MGFEDSIQIKPVLSETHIQEIMSHPKTFPGAFKDIKLKEENQHSRYNVDLITEGEYRMSISIRVSRKNPSNFSVILKNTNRAGYEYILRRYNGDHGLHINPDGERFTGCHIHKITESAQTDRMKEESYAYPTDKYQDWKGALSILMADGNIQYKNTNTNLGRWIQ